jgi:Major Facilitator Superfamily
VDRTPRGPRDLRLVTAGRVVSVLGDEVALVALMMRSHDLGLGPFGLTGLLIAFAVPTVVLAGWAGRVVDRFDSRGLIVATSLWQGLACAALAVAPARGPGGVLATYALVVVLQFGSAVGMPTWQALIPSIAGERQVARALGNLQAWSTMASVAGPAVGGQLAADPGFTTALLVDAASFAVLAALGALVTTRRGPAARPEPHPAGDAEAAGASEAAEAPEARSQATIGGLGLLRRDALLRPMIAGLLVLVVVAEGCNVAEVFMIRDVLRGSSSGFGYVQAVLAVGLVGGLPGWSVRRSWPPPARRDWSTSPAVGWASGSGSRPSTPAPRRWC